MIVDSHCHLDLLEQKDFDIDEIVKTAQENGVEFLQTICTKISEIDKITKFADKYDNVFASIGNHPCNVRDEGIISADEIIELAKSHKKIIGIGETGLDYYYEKESKNQQKQSFINHIEASQKTKKPLIIHARDADLDMIEILTSEQKNHEFPALLHCFASSENLARKALDLNIYISWSGIVTFKNAQDLQQIAKFVPLEKTLVETDSPYLAPTPHRGKTNQPAFTRYVVEFLAQLKESDPQEVAKITTQNFIDLFKVDISSSK